MDLITLWEMSVCGVAEILANTQFIIATIAKKVSGIGRMLVPSCAS
jgi:hypothetical protein